MHVVVTQSPLAAHKYRVKLPNKKTFDIGSTGSLDYTDHKDPSMMRTHLLEKGAQIPRELRLETDPYEIHRGMLYAVTSTEENWEDPFRAGYWERWLLWSYPNVNQAQLWMAMQKNILFMPTEEAMWFCDKHNKF